MDKLCKDQLADKLVPLFKDAENIDEAVKEAKNRLAVKAKQLKEGYLEKLFDSQIQTEKDRGTPEAIIEMLQNQRSDVLSKASEMTFAEGHIPFLPVIPKTYVSIYYRMPMVKNGNKIGYTYLDPSELTDIEDVPTKPYYIYDVEDGTAMLGKSPEKAEKLIRKDKRFPLTADEVMSLGIHRDVLSDHYVDATGSRYESSRVPFLYLFDGRPRLGWDDADDAYDRWGAGSCGSR